jgi:hypothetical protein
LSMLISLVCPPISLSRSLTLLLFSSFYFLFLPLPRFPQSRDGSKHETHPRFNPATEG